MKKTILMMALAATSLVSKAQNWSLDAVYSNVTFTVDYMVVSELEGTFKKYDAKVTSSKPDFTDIALEFTVDAASINTDNEMRDKHLKSEDFFNTEKYPSITFKSVSMKKIADKKYVMEGDLTLHGVTKRVKFDVTYGGTVKDPWGNTKAGFKATTKINRLDYGLKYNAALETGEMVASNEVSININTILIKQK